jgi:PAS domain S-box-containing protein
MEERYRDLYENAPVGYYVAGPDRIIRDVNQYLLDLLGYSREEVVGKKTLLDLMPPDYRVIYGIRIGKIQCGDLNGYSGLEFPMVHKDGRRIPVRQDVSVIRKEDGSIDRTRSVIADISELKKSMESQSVRLRYEKGLADCSKTLLTKSGSANPVPEALEYIRVAAQIGRICIFENVTDPDRGVCYLRTHETPFSSFPPGKNGEERTAAVPYFPRWVRHLSSLRIVSGSVNSFPEPERTQWSAEGVLSLLAVPLQVAGSWHGCLVFQDLKTPRVWMEEDVRMLRTVAEMVGNYIERKLAEERLSTREKQFRHLYNHTPVMLHSADETGKIISVSDYWLSVTGYRREEVLGRHGTDFLTEESKRFAFSTVYPQFKRNGWLHEIPFELVKKNGEVIDVLISATSERDEQGRFLRSLAVTVDVTERKRAEKALREREEHLQLITHSLPALISYVDSGRRFQFNNKVHEEWFQTPRAEMAGKTLQEILGTETVRKISDRIDTVLSGEGVEFETDIELPGGKNRCVHVNFVPHRDEGGEVKGFFSLMSDVTERKQMEDQRERLLQDLKRMNAELEDFAYVVSHDLKAPLRAISSLSKWIARDHVGSLTPEGLENFRLLENRAKRMNRLLEGILQFSRIGLVKPTLEPLDSAQVALEVIDTLSPPAGVRVRIEGPLPRLTYDRTQLFQLFLNLIENAVSHLGNPSGEVVVSCGENGRAWEFCVRDDGVGIEEKHFDRIFKIFQSLHPHEDGQGTGIGLTVVKKIVENHGGHVRVESRVGAGSRFYFTIPKFIKD